MADVEKIDDAATLAKVTGLQAWLRHAARSPDNPYFARRVEALCHALDAPAIDDVSERGLVAEAIRSYGLALAEHRRHCKYLGLTPRADVATDAVVKGDRFVSGKLAPSEEARRFARQLADQLPSKEQKERGRFNLAKLALAIEAASRVGRRAKGTPAIEAEAALRDALSAVGLAGSPAAIRQAARRAKKRP
jgi:hypothetical protein